MIDLSAGGIMCAMFGDRSQIIHEAIHRVDVFCSYASHRQDYWRDRYIRALKDLTGFESVALFSTGSEATEAFWRVARTYNGKPGVWGGLVNPDEHGLDHVLADSMHGWTLGSLIMAGRLAWPSLGVFPELGEKRFGMAPHATCGMIMEPYHAPSGQFHRDFTIKTILDKRREFPDILFCIDEVQGGFGRTGKLWAHEHYQDPEGRRLLKPDFVTIGKLCGGGMPLSALLGPKEVMESESVQKFGHLHSTHSGNPLMCSVGCAVIEEMQKQNLIYESARKGEILHRLLREFPVKSHGKGLMAGLEFENEEEATKIWEICKERGVWVVNTGRRWVKIGPQLNIEDDVLIEGIKILKEVVEEVVHGREIKPDPESVSPTITT